MMDDRSSHTDSQRSDQPQQPPVFPSDEAADVPLVAEAKYPIGLPVAHRAFGFRGVIFDIDPEFANSEEWYDAIPEEVRPRKDQPFYHLFAVNPQDETPYIAYVSEQNLQPTGQTEEDEIRHPAVDEFFAGMQDGRYIPRMPFN